MKSLDMSAAELAASRQREREAEARIKPFDPEEHARREDAINREITTNRVLKDGHGTLAQCGIVIGDSPACYSVGRHTRRLIDAATQGTLALMHGTMDRHRDGSKRISKTSALVEVDELRRWIHEYGTPEDHINAAGLWKRVEELP